MESHPPVSLQIELTVSPCIPSLGRHRRHANVHPIDQVTSVPSLICEERTTFCNLRRFSSDMSIQNPDFIGIWLILGDVLFLAIDVR